MPYASFRPSYLLDDQQARSKLISSVPHLAVADALRDKGWAKLEGFADHAHIERILADCDGEYGRRDHRLASPHRLLDGWKTSENVRALATDEKIIKLLSCVFGKEAFPFQTLNFDRGTEQALHADTLHFCAYPQQFMVGVWVALEDITEENGPLRYVEKSHQLPLIDMFSLGLKPGKPKHNNSHISYPDYEKAVFKLVTDLDLKVSTVTLKKGDAFIWSSNLIHGGAPIANPASTRFSQVTHYFFKDCLYYTPLVSDTITGRLALRTPVNVTTGEKTGLKDLLRCATSFGMSRRQILRSWWYTRTGR